MKPIGVANAFQKGWQRPFVSRVGPRRLTQAGTAFIVCAMALAGCTNASQQATAGTAMGGTSASSQFDASSVPVDSELAAMVPETIKSRGVLIVASDTTYAPAEFLGGSDNQMPMGYGVDLGKAIGATLGLKVDVQTAEFTGILPALGSKYDLGISSFSITNERLKAVNFVSYLNGGTSWAVQKGNPTGFNVNDPCGRSVGVETGTVQEDDLKQRNEACIAAGKKPVDIITLQSQTDITTRLVNGGLDAMIAEAAIVNYTLLQTNGALEKAIDAYDKAPIGIAVAKKDVELTSVVQKALTKLIADGNYSKILSGWNNADAAIDQPQVNPAVP